MKTRDYFFAAWVVATIVAILLLWGKIVSLRWEGIKKQNLIAAYQNAKPVWKTRMVYSSPVEIIYTSSPLPSSIVPTDTVYLINCDSLQVLYGMKKFYNDTVRWGDKQSGGKMRWSATVTENNLKRIDFDQAKIHHTDSVCYLYVDTCINKRGEYFAKNHLLIGAEISGSNVRQFPNTSAMVWWTIKDKVALGIGGEYNFYHNDPYLKIGGMFFLK